MRQASKQAVFFVYVWPEPESSAAGVRTYALISALLAHGYSVAAISPSQASAWSGRLNAMGVETFTCDPNRSEATEAALGKLAPSLAVYDRFVMEEQFGWRARALWPLALHLVDTQDLHSLRRARERLVAQGKSGKELALPTPEQMGEDLLRELASLYRADAALVVSRFEQQLLFGLGFPAARLLHLPFPTKAETSPAPFAARAGFAFLGNYRHAPNLDAARWLVGEVWPEVRRALPHAELHLYGSYPPAEISRHKGERGIFAHGPVQDHRAALSKHRALLTPLRFGAGIKGKVLEAFGTGTPVVGTATAFEGIGHEGLLAESPPEIAEACRAVHEEELLWNAQSEDGLAFARERLDPALLSSIFLKFVGEKAKQLPELRAHLTGAMLRHQQHNATKYFSRWIEAKNRPRA